MENAVILEGARTPIGNFLGSLSEIPAVELGVIATTEALKRASVQPDDGVPPPRPVAASCAPR